MKTLTPTYKGLRSGQQVVVFNNSLMPNEDKINSVHVFIDGARCCCTVDKIVIVIPVLSIYRHFEFCASQTS